jgi:DNA-binding SARP family transcriptional activator
MEAASMLTGHPIGVHPDHHPTINVARWPIMVCLLGSFRLLKAGQAVAVRSGGKTEALLTTLGLHHPNGVARETLLVELWPSSVLSLASQSLNSLIYSLHKLLGDGIAGAAPVVLAEGTYRLNRDAGVAVDVTAFDELLQAGECAARAEQHDIAIARFRQAVELYRGDLCSGPGIQGVVERERARALYLTTLARLSGYAFGAGDYHTSLRCALQLLAKDPCREDAHRLVMRAHLRRGERAQALRQYRLCEAVLREEFDAAPEPATRQLYERIRLDPASV